MYWIPGVLLVIIPDGIFIYRMMIYFNGFCKIIINVIALLYSK